MPFFNISNRRRIEDEVCKPSRIEDEVCKPSRIEDEAKKKKAVSHNPYLLPHINPYLLPHMLPSHDLMFIDKDSQIFSDCRLKADYMTAAYNSDDDFSQASSYYGGRMRPQVAANPKGISMANVIADPDGDSSSLCAACTLPIFSTPSRFISRGGGAAQKLLLHEQCANILPPAKLQHELHPDHTLHLREKPTTTSTSISAAPACSNCKRVCGSIFYQCSDPQCMFRLDLVCVLQIKVVHRSHNHAMTVIRQRGASSLTCGACDSKHDSPFLSETVTLSYLCNLCGFWIHPDCATLTFAIVHYEKHKHSLFLTYNFSTATIAFLCAICSTESRGSSGVYICLSCPDFLVHVRCALASPNTFKQVFLREAKAADLCRLPLADENTSLLPYIREGSDGDNHHLQQGLLHLHPHPLIFHEIDDDGEQSYSSRVCNACVQLVQPPFFSCDQCPDFFLHTCCAHLPGRIKHRAHTHTLILHPTPLQSDASSPFFSCKGCQLRCNGFAYSCESCDDFTMDVACAFINPAITHEFHKKTHILFMFRDTRFGRNRSFVCNCCNSKLSGICYDCSICPNFKLHVRCALLPKTVSHVFDEHPLQLIATGEGDEEWCEVCEQPLDTKCWYYSCGECNQSFHVDCIPSVDRLSRVKLGSTVRVDGHGCAVALARQGDVGRRCGGCGEMLKSSSGNGLAYECSDCFYGIHHDCAQRCLLQN